MSLKKGLGCFDGCDIPSGETYIGHVRWACQGEATVQNAHPIAGGLPGKTSCWVVHNGIIESYKEKRKFLSGANSYHYVFETDTDTEIIAHLFDLYSYGVPNTAMNARDTLRQVAGHLKGQYAFILYSLRFPDKLLLACNGSPLLFTMNMLAASDPIVFSGYAAEYMRMSDGDVAVFFKNGPYCWDKNDFFREWEPMTVPEYSSSLCDSTYMLKEIHEQPACIRKTAVAWLQGKMEKIEPERIGLFGCGSSYNAALLGRHYFEDIATIPTQVEYATELADAQLTDEVGKLWIALTQSGETKDTLLAMERLDFDANGYKPRLWLITNNKHSAAANHADIVSYLSCGAEIGVAATKTFTAQVLHLYCLALHLNNEKSQEYVSKLNELADAIDILLTQDISSWYLTHWDHILYLARGDLFPIALEGALKMKEVACIHAEAIHAAEMKHGPIALIDENTLSLVLVPHKSDAIYPKVLANIEEIQARKGKVLAICDETVKDEILTYTRYVIAVPKIDQQLYPLLVNVVLQLLALRSAEKKGLNVDKPKGLAKCVSV